VADVPEPTRRGLHHVAVEQLGKSIVRGDLAPSSVLDPVQLEGRFGVSRSVVRDAMRVLVEKGLVEARPRRGTTVRPRAQWNMLDADILRWQYEERRDGPFLTDLAEVRSILEPAAARLASQRRTDEDLASIDDAVQAMRDAELRSLESVHADVRFHRALLEATHNEMLQRMDFVIEAGLRARDTFVHQSSTNNWNSIVDAHAEVAAAVRDQDGDRAHDRMLKLIEIAQHDEPTFGTGKRTRRKR
jgi:GntR family galactonate operon transcriptional repressor